MYSEWEGGDDADEKWDTDWVEKNAGETSPFKPNAQTADTCESYKLCR